MSSKQSGASTLKGSKSAKQQLVVILETLGGACTTSEASERISVSLSRYYQLETRALQGMLSALEPRPRGPRKTAQGQIRTLMAEKKAVERELRQAQSLLRVASRSVGVKPKRKKQGARKRRASRGKTVLETIKAGVAGEDSDGTQEHTGSAAGADSSQ